MAAQQNVLAVGQVEILHRSSVVNIPLIGVATVVIPSHAWFEQGFEVHP
jgi:hypothetical protein